MDCMQSAVRACQHVPCSGAGLCARSEGHSLSFPPILVVQMLLMECLNTPEYSQDLIYRACAPGLAVPGCVWLQL